ncbi:hypothetical protein LPJ75_005430, partial [Coemansia sp. RSA 2598]
MFSARFVGGPRKRIAVLAAALLSLALYTLHSRYTGPATPSIPPANTPAYWLRFADHIPAAEYQALLEARSSRKPVFATLPASRWMATEQQHQELNRVIRAALESKIGNQKENTRIWLNRRQRAVDAARNAWRAYRRDAFGSDEYHP